MTMSRWKLLAGVFGLGVCGLAALAEPACRNTNHRQLPPVAEGKPKEEPKPVAGSTAPPPLEILPPLPGEVKAAPAPAPLPSLPPATPDPKVPAETKSPALPPVELTPLTVKDDKPTPGGLPVLPLPSQPSPAPNIPAATAVPELTPGALPGLPPLPGAQPAGALPLPGPQPMPVDLKPLPPAPKPEVKPLPLPQPALQEVTPPTQPAPEVKPLPLPGMTTGSAGPLPTPQPTPPAPPAPTPLPTPDVKPVEARSTTPTAEKRLKVTLQMGEGNPRFEIRDGDEVVLKVVSDKIDVKAPTEKGDLWSTLKASGRVKFQSPGGDGYCDELTIVPGTCEVIATGKVQFKYNWGKVETAVTSERMAFRLGATPETR